MLNSISARMLATLLVLPLAACGDDGGSGTGGGGGGGGGGSTPDGMAEVDYCVAAGGGCMTTIEEGGITYRTCTQWIPDGIPVPDEVESSCVDDDEATRSWLPDGCPRDGNMMCGTIGGSPNVGSRIIMINFMYSTGDPATDATYCTTCGSRTQCCEGPAFP